MSKINVSNINIYKNLKRFPLTDGAALSRIVAWFMQKIGDKQGANIIIYCNLNDQWIQISSDAACLQQEELAHLWTLFDSESNANCDWKIAGFYLGKYLGLESKSETEAYKTTLNLAKDQNEVDLLIVDRDKMMRNSTKGLRLNITSLNHKFDETELPIIYRELQNNLFWKFKENFHHVFLNVIDKQSIKNYDGVILKDVNGINESSPINIEPSHTLVDLDEHLYINNVSHSVKINVSDSNSKGIHISDGNTLIQSYYPQWFLAEYKHLCINLEITNLPVDLTKTKALWQQSSWDVLDRLLIAKLSELRRSKTIHQELESELVAETDLETAKLYLTKAFENTNSLSTRMQDFEISKDELKFTYCADDGKNITINLIKTGEISNDWLQINVVSENELDQVYVYNVKYNNKHPFFASLNKTKGVEMKIDHFIICYVIAETISRLDGSSVMQLKHVINKLLRGQ